MNDILAEHVCDLLQGHVPPAHIVYAQPGHVLIVFTAYEPPDPPAECIQLLQHVAPAPAPPPDQISNVTFATFEGTDQ